jgi:hypothetical protein
MVGIFFGKLREIQEQALYHRVAAGVSGRKLERNFSGFFLHLDLGLGV